MAKILEKILKSWLPKKSRSSAGCDKEEAATPAGPKVIKGYQNEPNHDVDLNPAGASSPLAPEVLQQLLVLEQQGAHGLLNKIINSYLTESPQSLVSLHAAIIAGNIEDVKKIAHSLKSSSGNLGAQHLFDLFKKLEEQASNNLLTEADKHLLEISLEYQTVCQALADLQSLTYGRETPQEDRVSSTKRPLVLVVDDDITTRMPIRAALEQDGLEVEEAGDGHAALAACKTLQPDLVLLDVMMPGMDGFSTCTGLRGLPGGCHLPIVMVTGLDDNNSINKAYEVGATSFISKPLNLSILCHHVRYILRSSDLLKELVKSDKRLTYAQHIAGLAYWEWNIVPNTMLWSGDSFSFLNFNASSQSVTLEAFLNYIHSSDRSRVKNAFSKAINQHKSFGLDCRIILPDGSERHVHLQGEVNTGNQGKILQLAGTIQDITERKRSEEAIVESEKKFRDLANLLPQPVFEMGLGGEITFANCTFFEAFGYSREDFNRGINAFQLLQQEDWGRVQKDIGLLLTEEKIKSGEYTALKADGSTFPIAIYYSPVEWGNNIVGLRGIILDLTKRLEREAELLRVQKLESLGVFAGGIAHDFNNILTVILGNLSLATLAIMDQTKLPQILLESEKAAFRAKDLAQRLLTFAKGGTPVKEITSLASILTECVSLAQSGSPLAIELELASNLWSVEVDSGQISQVFHNLLINAQQAMPDGGTIKVKADNIVLQSDYGLSLDPGEYIVTSIQDEGVGITSANLLKIFDPYFTTKQQGNGLGLATVYSIIKNHGGLVSVESIPGKGTTFWVYLSAKKKLPVAEPKLIFEPIKGNGRILFMDDEESVRDLAEKTLIFLGYEVELSRDGHEAIEKYEQALLLGNNFDLVMLDLTIPGGLGGQETLKKIREKDPQVKAIVISGYAEDPIMANYKDHGFANFLRKPFRIGTLSKILYRAMNE